MVPLGCRSRVCVCHGQGWSFVSVCVCVSACVHTCVHACVCVTIDYCSWKYWICMWLCEWECDRPGNRLGNFSTSAPGHQYLPVNNKQTILSNCISILVRFLYFEAINFSCEQYFKQLPADVFLYWFEFVFPYFINQKIHIWIAFPRTGQPHITFPCMGGQEVDR